MRALATQAVLPLAMGDNAGFQFKTHPNINKQLFMQKPPVIALKDPSRAFPTGSALGVLKWRLQTQDDSHVPLMINAWPTEVGDGFEVTVEYELNGQRELHDVRVAIPMGAPPSGLAAAAGEAAYDKRAGALVWTISHIDGANASGTVEFTSPSPAGADGFFPIHVLFTSPSISCEIDVPNVQSAEEGAALPFAKTTSTVVESYTVV